jgi:hypothetical protein
MMTTMMGRFGVAAALAFGLAIMTAGPALADSYDDEFIAKLTRAGVEFENADAKRGGIEMAKEGCRVLDAGYSNQEASGMMADFYGKQGVSAQTVMTVMSIGVLHYCPELMG